MMLFLLFTRVKKTLKGKLFNLKTGHYYYLDVTKPHSVSNNSNIDRYHLVVDCFVNDALKTLFNGIF